MTNGQPDTLMGRVTTSSDLQGRLLVDNPLFPPLMAWFVLLVGLVPILDGLHQGVTIQSTQTLWTMLGIASEFALGLIVVVLFLLTKYLRQQIWIDQRVLILRWVWRHRILGEKLRPFDQIVNIQEGTDPKLWAHRKRWLGFGNLPNRMLVIQGSPGALDCHAILASWREVEETAEHLRQELGLA